MYLRSVVRKRGLDCGNSIRETSRSDIDELKAQIEISLFVDPFKTQSILEVDSPRLARSDKSKIPHKKDALFENSCNCDTAQLAQKRVGRCIPKMGGEGDSTDHRTIVELHSIRLARGSDLSLTLQADNCVDKEGSSHGLPTPRSCARAR